MTAEAPKKKRVQEQILDKLVELFEKDIQKKYEEGREKLKKPLPEEIVIKTPNVEITPLPTNEPNSDEMGSVQKQPTLQPPVKKRVKNLNSNTQSNIDPSFVQKLKKRLGYGMFYSMLALYLIAILMMAAIPLFIFVF